MIKNYFILIMIILMGCDKEVARIDKSKVVKEKQQLPLVKKEKNLAKSEIPNSRKIASKRSENKNIKKKKIG